MKCAEGGAQGESEEAHNQREDHEGQNQREEVTRYDDVQARAKGGRNRTGGNEDRVAHGEERDERHEKCVEANGDMPGVAARGRTRRIWQWRAWRRRRRGR
eukprot:6171957-Pleurochrysis_carterae.AAC.5